MTKPVEKEYLVKSAINHDGKIYEAGSKIKLSDKHAKECGLAVGPIPKVKAKVVEK